MSALYFPVPGVTDLTGDPPVGQPPPDGAYWKGWVEFFDRESPERLRAYYCVTAAGEVFWLDGITAGGSGDWLPEKNDDAAEAVRAVARGSLQ